MLIHLIASWLVSALALWIVAQIIPGIQVRSFGSALVATVVIAIVNVTVGPVLRFLAWPLTILTLGLFLLVINALLLKLASWFTPGFSVHGFLSALAGSVVLTILSWILRQVFFSRLVWGTAL
jgi:putative membrane protein